MNCYPMRGTLAMFLYCLVLCTPAYAEDAKYKALVGDGGGLLGGRSLDLDEYVTEQAMDGLFSLIAEEEAVMSSDFSVGLILWKLSTRSNPPFSC